MSATETATTQELKTREARVWVNSWQYSREIEIAPDRVALQVTRPSCNHCHTCQGRVEEFKRTLAQKPGVEHAWAYNRGAYWLTLPKPAEQDGLAHLREALGLSSVCFC